MNKLAISSHRLKSTSSFRFIRSRSRRNHRDGLTLIELLIATGLTLLIIAAMIRAFKSSSESISLGRSKMDMHNKIRVVVETLRSDLQNATRTPNPLSAKEDGYFELIEGEEVDAEHATEDLSFIGDHDDILAMTVRTNGEPFRGRFNGGFVESYVAEVVWWIQHDDTNGDGEADYDESLRLYRRVLLIRPTGIDLTALPVAQQTDILTYYANNDVSVRPNGTGLATNSLADLTNRANRFAHNPVLFPHEMFTGEPSIEPASIFNRALTGVDEGFDLMLDNCVAFDLKVFDPTAEAFLPAEAGVSVGQVVGYDDPGFVDVVGAFPPASNGAAYSQVGGYVNLGYDPLAANTTNALGFGNERWFNNFAFENGYTFANNPATYCTWWNGYETDGLDQDGDSFFDEGNDGVDNDNAGGVDDNLERETRPPYAYPIRSLEARVRMIDKNTNQILQKTVRESFVPD